MDKPKHHKLITDEYLKDNENLFADKKVVFTNGCFDLLHPGHIHYLEKAKSFGDILIVGLNSDESIKRLKGVNRPINNVEFRVQMLAGLSSVDFIIIFESNTPLELITSIKPDVLIKGGDYTIDKIVGANETQKNGGAVMIIPFLKGYSSTSIIEKIQKLA